MNTTNIPIKYRSIATYVLGFISGFVIAAVLGMFTNSAKKPEITKPKEQAIKVAEVKSDKVDAPLNKICFEISGAVNTPGVYCAGEGAMLNAGIALADGFLQTAYAQRYVSQSVNLARLLKPNEKIYIPYFDEVKCELEPKVSLLDPGKDGSYIEGDADDEVAPDETIDDDTNSEPAPTTDCINLNTATKDELMELDGIGESTAQKIIDARPFEKIEDLLDVSGIGQAKYDAIKDKVCV